MVLGGSNGMRATGEHQEQMQPPEETAVPSGARGLQAGTAAGQDEHGGGGTMPQEGQPQVW